MVALEPSQSRILMLAPACGVLDVENQDFISGLIYSVIDKVGIFARYELSHAFDLLLRPTCGNKIRFCRLS
jgi:hypothetical protein